mmetsp:Transcript_19340/g.60539  ORF Transcript_19340/g.60539 Transcript_19340/m.60539 type:complete len:314 (-) Transcript_19340:92-1033(-)
MRVSVPSWTRALRRTPAVSTKRKTVPASELSARRGPRSIIFAASSRRKQRQDHTARRRAVHVELGVDRVARRARDVGDDGARGARPQETVHEARLADVRPAEQRDVDARRELLRVERRDVALAPRDGFVQGGQTRVQHLRDAVAVDRRASDRLAEPQGPKVRDHLRLALGRLALVDGQHRLEVVRRPRPQEVRDVLVRPDHARAAVDDDDARARLAERDGRLLADLLEERGRLVVFEQQAARVHHVEDAPAPLRALVDAVSRDPDLVDRDGAASPRVAEAIDQRRLADVGPADDGHRGPRAPRDALQLLRRFR